MTQDIRPDSGHYGLLESLQGSPNAKYFARSKLYELKQRSSVTKYISEFENLHSRIDELGEAKVIQAFFNGLKPKLQVHFARNPSLHVNLAMIMQIAESLDNVHHQDQVIFQSPQQFQYSNPDDGPQPMDINAVAKRRTPEKPIASISQGQRQK
ncbi:hypothetical protein BGX26_000642 [Mortierella sp. AD094]|nr:hypothetical protein BGX26_000642 [Mortierella sp. AD094]